MLHTDQYGLDGPNPLISPQQLRYSVGHVTAALDKVSEWHAAVARE